MSPNAPHRVLRNNQFYLRNSVGKETMDIHAIRTAFAFGDRLTDLLSPPVYVEDLGLPAAGLMAPALDPRWNAVGIDHTQTNFAGGGA
ncbi:hypothetical protein [Paraburkholderia aspalathi]|uniref:hypothetical protein n=1 Tax=Paraburkholderia aspalathi TaxID=1324617 RepID=UPI0038BB5F68